MGSKRGGWCNWEGFGKNTIELKIVVLDRSHHYPQQHKCDGPLDEMRKNI